MNRASKRRGFALMMVLAHVALLLAVWGLANRQTVALLGLESALQRRSRRAQGSLTALARGLALLETGLPPADPYSCKVALATPDGSVSYTVRYSSVQGQPDQWEVQAAPTAEGESPPDMPASFRR